MKLFTRLFLATSLLLPQVSAWAATFVVQVRNNEYSPQVVNVAPGDVVRFQWVEGVHPTVSDSSPVAFASFTPSASNPTRDVTIGTPGTYNYHCSAHGGPGFGMWGTINVSTATPVQEASRQAAALLSVYPNPVRGGQATLTMPDLKPGQPYRLRVTNIIGREMQNVALRPDQLSTGQSIDFSALPAGLYICSILSNDKILASKRVTVQN